MNFSSLIIINLSGSDIASGPVWMEYITFLKSMPVCAVSCPSLFFFLVYGVRNKLHNGLFNGISDIHTLYAF